MGIMHPYPLEWDLIPFPETYLVVNINKYHGKGSPNEHIYNFHSLIGNVMGDDALMSWLFSGSLKGITFDWLCTLPVGFIKFWVDLEAWFLTHFYEDDIEVSMPKHIEEKQRKGKFGKTSSRDLKIFSSGVLKSYLSPCCYKLVKIKASRGQRLLQHVLLQI